MSESFLRFTEISINNGNPNPGLVVNICNDLTRIPIVVMYNGAIFAREKQNVGAVIVSTNPLQVTVVKQFVNVDWQYAIFADTGSERFRRTSESLLASMDRDEVNRHATSIKNYFNSFTSWTTPAIQLKSFLEDQSPTKRMMTGFNPLEWKIVSAVPAPVVENTPPASLSNSLSSLPAKNSLIGTSIVKVVPLKKRDREKTKGRKRVSELGYDDEVTMEQARANIRDSRGFLEAPLSASSLETDDVSMLSEDNS